MRIGVGLSIPELSTRGGRFSPASLFTDGTVGAWYAPDDFSTLFQDSAGTTPVTAVEQPVGLMLDKSQGLVLGSELVTNGDFSGGTTGWTAGNSAVFSVTSGVATIQNGAAAVGNANQSFTTVVGRWYVATATFSSPAGGSTGGQIYIGTSAGTFGVAFNSVATGTVSLRFAATATTTFISLVAGTATNGASIQADNVSVKELPGNHASQATAASRPVLRARYNQLTYSEQFDNAATWGIAGVTRSADVTTAPDGTVTADRITGSTGSNAVIFLSAGYTAVAGNLTLSCYIKAGTADYAVLSLWQGSGTLGVNLWVNVQTGAVGSNSATAGYTFVSGSSTAVGNGWYRIVVTGTVPAGGVYPSVRLVDGDNAFNYTNTVGKTLFIWGADLRTGSSAGTYQRIAAATDYATAGFLPYLYFVTDDSFGTNSINFSATDKMSVCAGVTKLSDAAAQIVCELSATSSAGNNGSFAIISALSPSNYAFYLYGNALASRTATTYASPVTNVVSVKYDISQSTVPNEIAPQINGAVPTLADAGGAGTGNFGNYPLYIGRRNNATLPFEGRIYGLIVCGKALSASELSATESWMNSKTGAY